jgi:hypothetical protein
MAPAAPREAAVKLRESVRIVDEPFVVFGTFGIF